MNTKTDASRAQKQEIDKSLILKSFVNDFLWEQKHFYEFNVTLHNDEVILVTASSGTKMNCVEKNLLLRLGFSLLSQTH